MASTSAAEQKKRKSSDGLTIEPPAPVRTRIIPFEGLAPTHHPESCASCGRNDVPYDIFINHYGQDTKHTLADSIYKKLTATGLRVFLDKDELELGDFFPKALVHAIATASIHIAIFSNNYAKSPWCLEELVFMLSLQSDVKFIPIFFYVEPSTLRWAIEGKGDYAKEFYEYEKKNRYTQKLESWKSALNKASFYTGGIINNQSDEEAVIMNVVNGVLKELKKVRLEVARHPVGLDEAEEDFYKNIVHQSGSIQIVGIWGMGGAGKTTLAKHLYNKKSSSFKKSSFLFDIREAASRGQLHEKQKILLQELDLKHGSATFDNVDKGKEILRGCLRDVNVLIVLDDVDDKEQLDFLLPARDNLGQESLIIVTTRELRVLKGWDISAIYKINPLNDFYAMELFSLHAFGQPYPFIGFEELAKKFVHACCSLPLSLKVLGSLLHGESNKEYWQSQLDKLSRLLPNDIESRLKTSYDALDDEEKEMFLDVACFFIGWPSSKAIAVWDGSDWSGLHGWQILQNKCLVELEKNSNIRMHDHLRDLGRKIANNRSPYRLWSKQQIININIEHQQEAIQIRGMADAFGHNCLLRHGEIILNTRQGKRILALGSLGMKIFIGEGNFINEESSEFSRELLCFHCVGFAHKNLPSWLPLKNLRILNLVKPQSLEDLWECDDDVPLQLRQLNIYNDFQLKKISHSQRFRSLETLRIEFCGTLKILPSLAEATSLKQIVLRACDKLEKIESLGSLGSLETLSIKYCNKLNSLPSLAEASFLKEIELGMCGKLKKIRSLKGLRSLETLRIRNCSQLNTLPSLAEASSLKEIQLEHCTQLKKIGSLESLGSLETLIINECSELKTLPSLAEASSLKEIQLDHCWNLKKIESLESLRSLETLTIILNTELNTLPSLAEASSLKEIELSSCLKLEKIESLESLRSLETLIIRMCGKLKTLPSLAGATSLKKIQLTECSKLEKIESLESLRSLETLIINECRELKTLPSLAEATSLKHFELIGCKNPDILTSLGELTCLEDLKVLRSLKTLKVDMCLKVLTSFSMGASMLKLNEFERLESVEVVADRVVVEPSMQKWPREVIILTRAVIDEMSVRNFFTSFPFRNVVGDADYQDLTFCMPESTDDAEAILICFIVRDNHPRLSFYIRTDCGNKDGLFKTWMRDGGSIWVWMGIFPQHSTWLSSPRYHILLIPDFSLPGDANEKVTMKLEGWLTRGREESIREAFTRLSQS